METPWESVEHSDLIWFWSEKLRITSAPTPELISRVLDDVLRAQGMHDFGRGFDMKSALTKIITKLLGLRATEYVILSVIMFFQLILPKIASMNRLAAKILECPKISCSELNEPNIQQRSLFSYRDVCWEQAFKKLSVAWERYGTFLEDNNGLGEEMKFAVAQLLATDVRKAACMYHAEISIPATSQYEALGIPYSGVEDEGEHFHTSFRLLRQDLDKLCPENFDQFFNTTIKDSLKAIGAENADQGYWSTRRYSENDKETSDSDLNLLHGLEDLVPRERCKKFWERKRLAIYKKLRSSLFCLYGRAKNSTILSNTLGKGMALFVSMRMTGELFDYRSIDPDEFKQLCEAFAEQIPELQMLNDRIAASIVIPGLDLGNSESQAKPTSNVPKNIKEGMEDVRDFYERLLLGKLRSTDLTTTSAQLLYLDIGSARAAFDQRLIEEGNVSNVTTPSDSAVLKGSPQETALSPLLDPRKRTRASNSQLETDDASSNARKRPCRVKAESK